MSPAKNNQVAIADLHVELKVSDSRHKRKCKDEKQQSKFQRAHSTKPKSIQMSSLHNIEEEDENKQDDRLPTIGQTSSENRWAK